jgi:hypothetical protein
MLKTKENTPKASELKNLSNITIIKTLRLAHPKKQELSPSLPAKICPELLSQRMLQGILLNKNSSFFYKSDIVPFDNNQKKKRVSFQNS